MDGTLFTLGDPLNIFTTHSLVHRNWSPGRRWQSGTVKSEGVYHLRNPAPTLQLSFTFPLN